MRPMLYLILVSLVVGGFGCATPYRSSASDDGFSDTRLSENQFQVTFMGHGSAERVQELALLRAAELTNESGFRWFAIILEDGRGRASQRGTVGDAASFRYATAVPSVRHVGSKNRCRFKIQCFAEKPEDIYVFDAAFLEQSLKGKYKIE